MLDNIVKPVNLGQPRESHTLAILLLMGDLFLYRLAFIHRKVAFSTAFAVRYGYSVSWGLRKYHFQSYM